MIENLKKLEKKLKEKKEKLILKTKITTIKEEIDELDGKRNVKKDLLKGAKITGKGLGKGLKGLFNAAGSLGRSYESSTKGKKETIK